MTERGTPLSRWISQHAGPVNCPIHCRYNAVGFGKSDTLMMKTKVDFTEDEREALRAFAARGSRREPLFFVGREDVFETIEQQLREVREHGGSLANAKVVRGPPGSGKSALLNEFDKRYKNTPTIPVVLKGEELHNPKAVAQRFVQACGFDKYLLFKSRQKRVSARLGASWLGVGGEYGTSQISPMEHIERGMPVLQLLDLCLEMSKEMVFLVLVDEAQRVLSDKGEEGGINTLAVALSDKNTDSLKIMTVFAGLPDTGTRLSSVGVSPRLISDSIKTHLLGAFEEPEVRRIVEKTLAHEFLGLYRLPSHIKEAITDAIVEASDCYPRHIQSYLEGMTTTFERTPNGAFLTLDDLLKLGHKNRLNYYDELFDFPELKRYKKATSIVLKSKAPDEPFTRIEIDGVAISQCGMSEDAVEGAYNQAIHCGIFEEVDVMDETLRMPVPSFRTYAASGFDREGFL